MRYPDGGGLDAAERARRDPLPVRQQLLEQPQRFRRMPLSPGQGGYERGPEGLLAAARVYDDIEAPIGHP